MRVKSFTVVVLTACSLACGSGTNGASTSGTTADRATAGSASTSGSSIERKSVQPADAQAAAASNSTIGESAAAKLVAGAAIAAEIQRQIHSDPRITSTDIQVTFEPRRNANTDDSIRLTGTVATEDERVAAANHVRKMTTMSVSGALSVVPPSSAQSEDAAPGAWNDPGGAPRPAVPLCPGLTVVTAIASDGDYESIKTIVSVDPNGVRVRYSSESGPPWWSPFRAQRNLLITHRTVLANDLESAHSYHQIFVGTKQAPETAPGTTAIGTSAAVLRELKSQGESELSLCKSADDAHVMRDGKQLIMPGGCNNFTDPFPIRRVGTEPVRMRVLVDGVPADLPAVQARGTTPYGERMEFFFLDDERNPLTLAFRLGIGEMPALDPATRKLCENEGKKDGIILQGLSCDLPDGGDRETLRAIKITTRCAVAAAASAGGSGGGAGPGAGAGAGAGSVDGASALEKALAETGTVDIYSIYFSFNSDGLRDESKPTLQDIAAVLRRHPDWKLGVTGHTDGIGSDQFNLDLSRRRAAAVKNALVKDYKIDPARLSTNGQGESSPKDTNETLEGRARNRRVELIRSST